MKTMYALILLLSGCSITPIVEREYIHDLCISHDDYIRAFDSILKATEEGFDTSIASRSLPPICELEFTNI